jgi:uncharacterized protein involved in outer membrane biogenesis
MDKNEITGDIRVVASTLIAEQEVKKWIANGRFEGDIDFDTNKENYVQVVIKSDVYQNNLKSLAMMPKDNNVPVVIHI